MKIIVIIATALAVSACSPSSDAPASDQTAAGSDAMAQWARSCALCHVNGEGGAPIAGDREAWQPRMAQGEDVLLTHTLEGFNSMPPLGYCMDCEEQDFRALIRFMGGDS